MTDGVSPKETLSLDQLVATAELHRVAEELTGNPFKRQGKESQRGTACSVFPFGQVADVRGDARTNLEILGQLGLTVVEVTDDQAWELHYSEISRCGLIVDAIFGTGLNTALRGLLETVVADINATSIPVVSIDLPTGLSADTHELLGQSIEATLTVTMAAPKIPLVLPPAETRAGDLVIADIGIPAAGIDDLAGPYLALLSRDPCAASLVAEPASDQQADRTAQAEREGGDVGRLADIQTVGALQERSLKRVDGVSI